MIKKQIFIFDLDGTLSLNEHRDHYITGKTKDWDGYFEACDKDEPNVPVITVFNSLCEFGNDIRIWSGRSDAVREKSLYWLARHTKLHFETLDTMLTMRPAGDYTPDEVLKEQWFEALTPVERSIIVAIFDDRQKVVDMWRRKGLTCFQVAEGNF